MKIYCLTKTTNYIGDAETVVKRRYQNADVQRENTATTLAAWETIGDDRYLFVVVNETTWSKYNTICAVVGPHERRASKIMAAFVNATGMKLGHTPKTRSTRIISSMVTGLYQEALETLSSSKK